MRKVAIFTEGHSELIFVRHLLHLLFGYESLSFECFKLHAHDLQEQPYGYSPPDPDFYFLLVNVGNDSRVVSAIRDREAGLFSEGYEHIIGLRDMYSEEYCDRSQVRDDTVIQEFANSQNAVIAKLGCPDKIQIHFAIMEFEAWLLAMYDLFQKIDRLLTVEHIDVELGFDLRNIDPEREFFHPTIQFGQILNLVGRRYGKSEDQLEGIVSKIVPEDLQMAVENHRCMTLASFLAKLEGLRHRQDTLDLPA